MVDDQGRQGRRRPRRRGHADRGRTTSTRCCSPARPAWSSTRRSSRRTPSRWPPSPPAPGPFTVTSYTQNDHAEMEKNEQLLPRRPDQGRAASSSTRRPTRRPRSPRPPPASTTSSGSPPRNIEAAKSAGLEVQVLDSMFVSVLDVQHHDGAVRQPGGGRGAEVRHRPRGDQEDVQLRGRRRQLPAVPEGVRRPQRRARRPLRLRPREGQADPGRRRARRTA